MFRKEKDIITKEPGLYNSSVIINPRKEPRLQVDTSKQLRPRLTARWQLVMHPNHRLTVKSTLHRLRKSFMLSRLVFTHSCHLCLSLLYPYGEKSVNTSLSSENYSDSTSYASKDNSSTFPSTTNLDCHYCSNIHTEKKSMGCFFQ